MVALRTVARLWRCPGRKTTAFVPRAYHRQLSQNHGRFLKVSEEVQDALETGKPVVALETTIYTHGRSLLEILHADNLAKP
jgi:hypothetical protein